MINAIQSTCSSTSNASNSLLTASSSASNNLLLNGNSSKNTKNNNSNNFDVVSIASCSSSSSSSSIDLDQDHEAQKDNRIKVGPDYQTDLSFYDPRLHNQKDRNSIVLKEYKVWSPTFRLSENEIDRFIEKAIKNYSYNKEQALALLFWNQYDLNKSYDDLNNYAPKPNDWTREEKILFEQAYSLYGKNFNKIKNVLPDKSVGCLVTYYYAWKKNRFVVSAIEHLQPNNSGSKNKEEDEDENENSNSNSDENDSEIDEAFDSNINQICCNCDFISNDLQSTPKGLLCQPCYVYWKESAGLMRPDYLINKTSSSNSQTNNLNCSTAIKTNRYMTLNGNQNATGCQSSSSNLNNNTSSNGNESLNNISKEARNFHKSLRKPPKGIYLNYDELVELAQADSQKMFEQYDKQIYFLKRQAQENKQEIDSLGRDLNSGESLTSFDPYDNNFKKLCYKLDNYDDEKNYEKTLGWTQDELMLALLSFNKYGDDLDLCSQIIKTKSQSSIRSFYNYYKESLKLDKLIFSNSKALSKRASLLVGELRKQNNSEILINNEISSPISKSLLNISTETSNQMAISPAKAVECKEKEQHGSDDEPTIL